MFGWRKKDSSDDENLCPYCNSPNPLKAEKCSLCYYELNRSAREQPMAAPSSTDSEIMSALLNEDFEEAEEDEVVEAILTLDEVTVEVDQFDITQNKEEDFQYIDSTGPTLSEIKDYQTPDEAILSKSDAPKKEVDFIVPTINPLDEVLEPVHTGQGSLFSVSSKNDFDLDEIKQSSLHEPGNTNMDPQIINEGSEDKQIDLASSINEEIEQQPISTPEIPDFPESTPEIPDIPETLTEIPTPEIPEIPDVPAVEPTTGTPEIPEIPTPEIPDMPAVEPTISTPEIPEILESEIQPKESPEDNIITQTNSAPIPQHDGRIWPWPAKQSWDDRQVYREVVTMLELVKSGKLVQTAETLDKLGPHLSINLEMLAHIGTIMRYLGREDHLQWMLKMAQTVYPNDERVLTAINHLSN
jgi:hypothetical protein